jgi:hypothetical protein
VSGEIRRASTLSRAARTSGPPVVHLGNDAVLACARQSISDEPHSRTLESRIPLQIVTPVLDGRASLDACN